MAGSEWGRSSIGRAPGLQPGGQGFDPPRLHQFDRPQIRPLQAAEGVANAQPGALHLALFFDNLGKWKEIVEDLE